MPGGMLKEFAAWVKLAPWGAEPLTAASLPTNSFASLSVSAVYRVVK